MLRLGFNEIGLPLPIAEFICHFCMAQGASDPHGGLQECIEFLLECNIAAGFAENSNAKTTLPTLPSTLLSSPLLHSHLSNKPLSEEMLRRKPTTITLTSEDIAAYDDSRAAERNRQENVEPDPAKGDGKLDPNDELKPLPGDRPRVRSGLGSASGLGREERIVGR